MREFSEKSGVDVGLDEGGAASLTVDGVGVTAQFRPQTGDVVVFTLPLDDLQVEEPMMRRGLELSAHGIGTDGFYLGLQEEEWGDMGPDGRNPILTMTFIALLDKTPEIAAKFNEYRDVFTNPSEELDAKYLENGSVNAIAISNVLAPLIKQA